MSVTISEAVKYIGVDDFILERLFRRYMSPEDLEREKENDMYAS